MVRLAGSQFSLAFRRGCQRKVIATRRDAHVEVQEIDEVGAELRPGIFIMGGGGLSPDKHGMQLGDRAGESKCWSIPESFGERRFGVERTILGLQGLAVFDIAGDRVSSFGCGVRLGERREELCLQLLLTSVEFQRAFPRFAPLGSEREKRVVEDRVREFSRQNAVLWRSRQGCRHRQMKFTPRDRGQSSAIVGISHDPSSLKA